MPVKKIKQLALGASAAAVLLGGTGYAGYVIGQNKADQSSVQYIDSDGSGQSDAKNLSDADDAIEAEQIVVKITDEGYVTSHGDHFHYYNGKVPFDAIISEELVMKDPNYQLRQEDIINEVQDGYIIKVNGKYYLYLKDPKNAKNVRTKEQIEEQRKLHNVKEHGGSDEPMSEAQSQAVAQAKEQGRYTTDDGYVFTVGSIVQDAGDAYICSHGDHFHYVPKADLSPAELAAAQAYMAGRSVGNEGGTTAVSQDDDYVAQRLAQSGYGQFVENNGEEGQANNEQEDQNGEEGQANNEQEDQKDSSSSVQDPLQKMLDQLYSLPMDQRHVEPDGLVFDPMKVTKRTPMGYVHPHGDHFHVIPLDQLSDLEVAATEAHLNRPDFVYQGADNANTSTEDEDQKDSSDRPTDTSEENSSQPSDEETGQSQSTDDAVAQARREGRYTTDDGYIFTPESILSDEGDAYICRHEDHKHYVPKADLSQEELAAAQAYLARKHNSSSSTDESNKEESETDQEEQSKEEEAPAVSRKTPEEKYAYLKSLPESQRTRDGDLIFDPKMVEKETNNRTAYVVPHGDHHHVIEKSRLTALERELAEYYLMQKWTPSEEDKKGPEPKPSQEDKKGPESKPSQEDQKESDTPKPKTEYPKKLFTAQELKDINIQMAYPHHEKDGEFYVYHYDHWHKIDDFLLNTWFNNDQEKIKKAKASMRYLLQHPEYKLPPENGFGVEPGEDYGEVPSYATFNGRRIKQFNKGLDGKPYTTDDNYTFNKKSIISVESDGVNATHVTDKGRHTHFIPLGELEQSELRQVEEWMRENGQKVTVTEDNDTLGYISKENAEKAAKEALKKDFTGLNNSYRVFQRGEAWFYELRFEEKTEEETKKKGESEGVPSDQPKEGSKEAFNEKLESEKDSAQDKSQTTNASQEEAIPSPSSDKGKDTAEVIEKSKG